MTTYTENCSQSIIETPFGLLRSMGQALQHSFEVQKLKAIVARERQQLLEIPAAMLKDMGITRAQAKQEAQRVDLPQIRMANLAKERC